MMGQWGVISPLSIMYRSRDGDMLTGRLDQFREKDLIGLVIICIHKSPGM